MLFFGAIAGGLAGLAGFSISEPPHFNVTALLVTLAVFFIVGFVYLDRGAVFIAMCVGAILMIFSGVSGTALHEPNREDFSPKWCLFALIAWLAAIMYILLNF